MILTCFKNYYRSTRTKLNTKGTLKHTKACKTTISFLFYVYIIKVTFRLFKDKKFNVC